MSSIEKEPIYDMYCISRRQYQRFLNILFGDVSVAQLVASVSGVVLGGVAEVVGSNLARGKIITASIDSVDSLYPSAFIYCLYLHQFLILCSSKAMMFVKLYFRTSDIYLISLVSLDPSGFHNLDIMRQSACLVLNPITVYSYGFLFNCTTVGQASDSMTALT